MTVNSLASVGPLLVDETNDANLPQGKHSPVQPTELERGVEELDQLSNEAAINVVAYAIMARA